MSTCRTASSSTWAGSPSSATTPCGATTASCTPSPRSSGSSPSRSSAAPTSATCRSAPRLASRSFVTPRRTEMEGGFGFPFGGDPEELMRNLREFAEQQAESVQEAQREQFATLTLNTAVELSSAALAQIETKGAVDEQAIALRDAMRVLFPEAVALVSAARQGFMRER